MNESTILLLFGVMEIPVYLLTAFAAYIASSRLKGGVFSSGMRYISAGMFLTAFANLYFFLQGLPGSDVGTRIWGPAGDAFLIVGYPVLTSILFLIGFFKFILIPSVYSKSTPANVSVSAQKEKDKSPIPHRPASTT